MSAWFIEGVFSGRNERRRQAPTVVELSMILLDREVEAATEQRSK